MFRYLTCLPISSKPRRHIFGNLMHADAFFLDKWLPYYRTDPSYGRHMTRTVPSAPPYHACTAPQNTGRTRMVAVHYTVVPVYGYGNQPYHGGSDVLGRAGLKSPGLGWAFVGLGLWRCWAQPSRWAWAGLGLAWAWARACDIIN